MKNKIVVADFNNLEDKKPIYALVSKTDLVIIKYDENVSVFYGRCLHRGATLGIIALIIPGKKKSDISIIPIISRKRIAISIDYRF